MQNAVKQTESALQRIPGDTGTVVAGNELEPLSEALKRKSSRRKPLAPKIVSPINDRKTHPDPTLAQAVATMSFSGFTMDQVCNALRMSEATVRKHYDYEFKNGQTNLVSEIAGTLAQRALSGSDSAAIFLLKTRGGGRFNERTALELTGKDGGAIQVEHRMLLDRLAGAIENGITLEHQD